MIVIPNFLYVLSIKNELINVNDLITYDKVFYGKSLKVEPHASFPFHWDGCEIVVDKNVDGLNTFVDIEFNDIILTLPSHIKVLTLFNNKAVWKSAANLNSMASVVVFIFHSLITTLNPTRVIVNDEDFNDLIRIGTRLNKPMFLGIKDQRYKNYNLSLVATTT